MRLVDNPALTAKPTPGVRSSDECRSLMDVAPVMMPVPGAACFALRHRHPADRQADEVD